MTPPRLSIRRWVPADHDAVWDLHNLALHTVGAHAGNGAWDDDLHHVEDVYFRAGGEFLVGELDGRIVAMGALRPGPDATGEITRMRVQPDRQRRGHGRAILLRLLDRARELGVKRLWLETTTQQHAAQAMYLGEGFVRAGERTSGEFCVLRFERAL